MIPEDSDLDLPLGDRMKSYEELEQDRLAEGPFIVIRVDGKSFHTYLREASKPFDHMFMRAMEYAAKQLCDNVPDVVLAYVQSDEISLLIRRRPDTEMWFGAVKAKLISITAAYASVYFNIADGAERRQMAVFDSRVFALPDSVEAANYLVWRQQDWIRNAAMMVARARFKHRELQSRKIVEVKAMLLEAGVDFDKYSESTRLGRVCVRRTEPLRFNYTHSKTGVKDTVTAIRSWWEIKPAPTFSIHPDEWLGKKIWPDGYEED